MPSKGRVLVTLAALVLLSRPSWPQGERVMKVHVEGAQIHVEVDGPPEAPAVLLWNGAGCTVRMWDRVVPFLDFVGRQRGEDPQH